MVATLLRLRFRVLGNTLLRNPWQLVAVILGAFYVLGMLLLVGVGLVVLGGTPTEVVQATLVIGGAAVTLGWFLVPLFTTGIESTLDPVRLGPFPIPTRTLMLAMLLVGLCWIPGGATTLIAMGAGIAWWAHPLAAVVALLCGIPAAVICVAGSRMMAALTTSLSGGRGWAIRLGIVAGVLLALVGPIALAVLRGTEDPPRALLGVASVIEWTPLGALWSVAGEVAAGHPLLALARLAIGLGTLAVVLAIWRGALRGTVRHRGRATAPVVGSGRLGALAWFPASPAGAIAARSFSYWVRDPRYLRQLVIVPLVPVLLFVYAGIGLPSVLPLLAGPVIAGLLPLTLYASISFDGTAFGTEIISGVRGIDDRIGRVAGIGVFALPAVLIITVASCGVSGRWDLLPALLGLSIGMLATGLAVTSISSSFLVIPVPAAKDSPFSAAAGAGVTSVLGSLAVTGVTTALGIPEIVLAVVAIATGQIAVGWATLAVGLLLGGLLLVIGLRVGGRLLDRNATGLLLRLQRMRG